MQAHNVRVSSLPKPVKYFEMFALMVMWKWFYYAPNTGKSAAAAAAAGAGASACAACWQQNAAGKKMLRSMPPCHHALQHLSVPCQHATMPPCHHATMPPS
jgi:hypothetical protein